MRTALGLIRVISILLVPRWLAAAEQPARFSQPVLGYVYDSSAGVVRVMLGVPGAASLDPAFDWKDGALSVSPGNTFGLAMGKSLALADWAGGPVRVRALGTVEGSPASVTWSPAGRTAAVAWEAGVVQVWTGLPDNPSLKTQLDLELPAGAPVSFAVSDDGGALAALAGGSLMKPDGNGGLAPVDPDRTYSAIAFAPGSSDLAASDPDDDQVALFRDLGSSAAGAVLAGTADGLAGPAALAFSRDGRRLVVANQRTGVISVLDLGAGTSLTFDCQCQPEGFYPLRGNAVFRLNQSAKGNLTLLDADGEAPRTVLVSAEVEGSAQ